MMTQNSRYVIGVDYGSRRLGVAIASLDARIASPLITIEADNENAFINGLKNIINSHNSSTVIVGLPRGMDGQETNQTAIVREFAKKVKSELGVKVCLQDEAGTSLLAEEELNKSKKPFTKGDIDKLSATYILHDWLSGATVEEL